MSSSTRSRRKNRTCSITSIIPQNSILLQDYLFFRLICTGVFQNTANSITVCSINLVAYEFTNVFRGGDLLRRCAGSAHQAQSPLKNWRNYPSLVSGILWGFLESHSRYQCKNTLKNGSGFGWGPVLGNQIRDRGSSGGPILSFQVFVPVAWRSPMVLQ